MVVVDAAEVVGDTVTVKKEAVAVMEVVVEDGVAADMAVVAVTDISTQSGGVMLD